MVFTISTIAGLVLGLLCVVLLIRAYIKNKGFALPLVLFVLSMAVVAGSLFCHVRGGLDIGPIHIPAGTEPAEDAGEADPEPEPDGGAPEPEPDGGAGSGSPDEALKMLIESGLSSKYDGYTLDMDEASITVSVWRESTTKTVEFIQEHGGSAEDEDWMWLKEHAQNSVDYILDCIRTDGPDSCPLTFHVYGSEAKDSLLLTFTDGEITYDILAGEPAAPASAEQPARASAPAPARTSQPEPSAPAAQPPAGPAPQDEPQPEPETPVQQQDAAEPAEPTGPQLPPDTASSSAAPQAGQNSTQLPPPVSAAPQQNDSGSPSENGGQGSGWDTETFARPDWPEGKLLGSTESDKYHSGNCAQGAARIRPENEVWFDSEEDAQRQGYTRCGICYR